MRSQPIVSRAVWCLASTFHQGNEMIGASARKTFSAAVGPPDLDAINLCAAKSEMQPHIIIGDIAGATPHLLHKLVTPSNNRNLGADAVAIRLCTSRDNAEPIV